MAMNFSRFSGVDPNSWISEMETILCGSDLPAEMWVVFSLQFMIGRAESWVSSNTQRIAEMNWCDLVYNLLWEFGTEDVKADARDDSSVDQVQEISSRSFANLVPQLEVNSPNYAVQVFDDIPDVQTTRTSSSNSPVVSSKVTPMTPIKVYSNDIEDSGKLVEELSSNFVNGIADKECGLVEEAIVGTLLRNSAVVCQNQGIHAFTLDSAAIEDFVFDPGENMYLSTAPEMSSISGIQATISAANDISQVKCKDILFLLLCYKDSLQLPNVIIFDDNQYSMTSCQSFDPGITRTRAAVCKGFLRNFDHSLLMHEFNIDALVFYHSKKAVPCNLPTTEGISFKLTEDFRLSTINSIVITESISTYAGLYSAVSLSIQLPFQGCCVNTVGQHAISSIVKEQPGINYIVGLEISSNRVWSVCYDEAVVFLDTNSFMGIRNKHCYKATIYSDLHYCLFQDGNTFIYLRRDKTDAVEDMTVSVLGIAVGPHSDFSQLFSCNASLDEGSMFFAAATHNVELMDRHQVLDSLLCDRYISQMYLTDTCPLLRHLDLNFLNDLVLESAFASASNPSYIIVICLLCHVVWSTHNSHIVNGDRSITVQGDGMGTTTTSKGGNNRSNLIAVMYSQVLLAIIAAITSTKTSQSMMNKVFYYDMQAAVFTDIWEQSLQKNIQATKMHLIPRKQHYHQHVAILADIPMTTEFTIKDTSWGVVVLKIFRTTTLEEWTDVLFCDSIILCWVHRDNVAYKKLKQSGSVLVQENDGVFLEFIDAPAIINDVCHVLSINPYQILQFKDEVIHNFKDYNGSTLFWMVQNWKLHSVITRQGLHIWCFDPGIKLTLGYSCTVRHSPLLEQLRLKFKTLYLQLPVQLNSMAGPNKKLFVSFGVTWVLEVGGIISIIELKCQPSIYVTAGVSTIAVSLLVVKGRDKVCPTRSYSLASNISLWVHLSMDNSETWHFKLQMHSQSQLIKSCQNQLLLFLFSWYFWSPWGFYEQLSLFGCVIHFPAWLNTAQLRSFCCWNSIAIGEYILPDSNRDSGNSMPDEKYATADLTHVATTSVTRVETSIELSEFLIKILNVSRSSKSFNSARICTCWGCTTVFGIKIQLLSLQWSVGLWHKTILYSAQFWLLQIQLFGSVQITW